MHISLESCIGFGLITDSDTLQWLEKNIPTTLSASRNSKVALDVALEQFTTWLSSCHKSTKANISSNYPTAKFDPTDLQIMIWAYGSTQDCRWMESAYKACELKSRGCTIMTFVSEPTAKWLSLLLEEISDVRWTNLSWAKSTMQLMIVNIKSST